MEKISLTSNPYTVAEADFPIDGKPEEQWRFLLNYALLAPSEYNTQPWLFKVYGSHVEIHADFSRRLPIVDPDDRELLISCGAACFNLRIAARHFGWQEGMELCLQEQQPGLLARLWFGERGPGTSEEHRLFAAIPHRHSNRSVFEDRQVPEELLAALQGLADQEGSWLQIIQKEKQRQAIAELIVAGDRSQWADQRFRQELATWLMPRGPQAVDGLPGYTHARGTFANMTNPFVVRTFDLWREEAAKDQLLVSGAPALLILGTFADTPADWFTAGQIGEHVLLKACASGLQTSFVNQPIEVPSLRSWLSAIIGCHGFPQLVLRIGYGPEAQPTPRRSVKDTLL